MVLTNFEWWAHGGAVVDPNGLPANSQNADMFNPRMVQQRLNTATGVSAVSHISSNGYYGFSYVNAAHEPADNNNHTNNNATVTHNNDAQNITNMYNNNNSTNNNNKYVSNENDVNGMDVGGAVDGAAAAPVLFSSGMNATKRCKKRYFVSDDDYAKCALLNGCDRGGVAGMGMDDVAVTGIDVCAAVKRCRFDDDYSAAQYCNDFFSLPSTQIGTQACLMDTEDTLQQQQQQVVVNMGAANNNNNETTNTTTKGYKRLIENEANNSNSILIIHHNNNNNKVNTANQNNKHFYNNQVSKYSSINKTTFALTNCGSSDSASAGANDNAATKGEQVGLVTSALNENVYHMNQPLFPAFTFEDQQTLCKSLAPPTAAEDGSAESAVVAALYAKTHGGSFYQFTASHGGNQHYIEDI